LGATAVSGPCVIPEHVGVAYVGLQIGGLEHPIKRLPPEHNEDRDVVSDIQGIKRGCE